MEKIGISPGSLIVNLVNFLVVFGIFWYLAGKQLLKFFSDRKARIAKSLEDAKANEEMRAKIKEERTRVLSDAHAEAARDAETLHAEIDKQAKALRAAAEEEAKIIREKAEDDARHIKAVAIVDAGLLFKDVVIEAATRIVGKSLTIPENMLIEEDLLAVPPEALALPSPITVKSATELTVGQKDRIQAAYGQRNVQLMFVVELAILCGLVFQSGSQVVDASGLMRAKALQEALKAR